MAKFNQWALIMDGVVHEITDINPAGRYTRDMIWVGCASEVLQGWVYDEGKFRSPDISNNPSEPIPTITPRQFRLWLMSRGLLSQVPGLIDTMPEPDKSIARIEWEFATLFDHAHPFIQALGEVLGLTGDDIEAGFREAALL